MDRAKRLLVQQWLQKARRFERCFAVHSWAFPSQIPGCDAAIPESAAACAYLPKEGSIGEASIA